MMSQPAGAKLFYDFTFCFYLWLNISYFLMWDVLSLLPLIFEFMSIFDNYELVNILGIDSNCGKICV